MLKLFSINDRSYIFHLRNNTLNNNKNECQNHFIIIHLANVSASFCLLSENKQTFHRICVVSDNYGELEPQKNILYTLPHHCFQLEIYSSEAFTQRHKNIILLSSSSHSLACVRVARVCFYLNRYETNSNAKQKQLYTHEKAFIVYASRLAMMIMMKNISVNE